MSTGSFAMAAGSFTPLHADRAVRGRAEWRLRLDPRIRKVDGLMQRNLHLKLGLREMAAAIALSPSRFSHLFKAQTGVSPAQYLKSLRLEKARDLLGGSHLSIKEVAAQVGLEPNRFCRNFRGVYGVRPLQYRLAVSSGARDDPGNNSTRA